MHQAYLIVIKDKALENDIMNFCLAFKQCVKYSNNTTRRINDFTIDAMNLLFRLRYL